jgi:hypothetical protein
MVFFYGAATQRGLWPPHSWRFYIKHNDAPQSVGLLWTSDQLSAETSNWQQATLKTNIYAPGGIRTHDLSRRVAAVLRLRPRGVQSYIEYFCWPEAKYSGRNILPKIN